MADTEDDIKGKVLELRELELSVQKEESQLMQIPEVAAFFKRKREVDDMAISFWKNVEADMINAGVKTIKGEWGSLTIAEKLDWETTGELPPKFYKKVVDKKRISDTYKLENKPIKGATPRIVQYLTKRFK